MLSVNIKIQISVSAGNKRRDSSCSFERVKYFMLQCTHVAARWQASIDLIIARLTVKVPS